MQDTVNQISDILLMWLLLLLSTTFFFFVWRCHRAGIIAAFGRHACSTASLIRLAVAAGVPALLCGIWLAANPERSDWAWLGTAHLAATWYGLRSLLPDGLISRSESTAH